MGKYEEGCVIIHRITRNKWNLRQVFRNYREVPGVQKLS